MQPSLTLCCLLLVVVLGEAATRKPKKPPTDVNRTDKMEQAGDKGDRAAERRDQTAQRRDQTAEKRDQTAEKRDQTAEKRDQTAEKRDQTAEKRDQAAEKRDQTAEKSEEATGRVSTPQTLARGWGDEIDWIQTYEEALAITRTSKKPLMVIHHLDACPYSQALKKAFIADPLVQKMAKEDFVMLNVVHPIADANLAPDGHYVPRIMFIDPSLTVRTDIAGRYGNRMYAYESDDIPELITSMKKAKVLLHTEL